jgi:orotate phosphoribosyltransferase
VTPLRTQLLEVIETKGLRRLPEPVQLASGEWSSEFIDGKEALAHWDDLELASRAIVEAVRDAGIDFTASGGLTMGADALAVGVASVARCNWFFVRKEAKNRGTRRLIEGTRLGPGDRVLLVEDVISTGGSILQAHEAIVETGATVVAAATLVDRSDLATTRFAELGVPYFPMATYRDLDIPPVGLQS